MPTVGPGRDDQYVEAAREFLPRIKELGELTGNNANQQLAFFKLCGARPHA